MYFLNHRPPCRLSPAVMSVGLLERQTKKIRKPQDMTQVKCDFYRCPSKNVIRRDVKGKEGMLLHIANAFLCRFGVIWVISRLKISKMSKNSVCPKAVGVNELSVLQ